MARVWRYPVKSMGGERTACIDLTATGVAGDRRYALRDPAGRLGSGKGTGRFRKVDSLLRWHARYEGDEAVVTFPDGTERAAGDPATGPALAAALGHDDLVLERVDDGSHVDSGAVHLVTTASLAWLARTLPEAQADERRFRPNLVIEADGDTPVEQEWPGATLRIGDAVVLRVAGPTERCGMVALAQEGLAHDPLLLRHITRNADLSFGVYADVLAPGRVCAGDPVTLEPAA